MSRISPAVLDAFHVAAAELGMCSAAWLFVREVAAEGGDALVAELGETVGLEFAVVQAVAGQWLQGARAPHARADAALTACAGAEQVVLVGLEADCLDVLVPKLQARATLLTHPNAPVDWERVAANFSGRLHTLDMTSVQRLAGARSVLLTFCYGTRGTATWVDPLWMRVIGGDVRTQFRSIIGWEILGAPMELYPRWLTETSAEEFSELVS